MAVWLVLPTTFGLMLIAISYRKLDRRKIIYVLVGLSLIFLTATSPGCGGGGSGNAGSATPPGTYTLVVNGAFSSGSTKLEHTANFTVVVQ